MMAECIVGIDLGTTQSLIGVVDSGLPILLADGQGCRVTPSVVSFPSHGDPVVGEPARRARALHPERTVSSVKRLMGRRLSECQEQSPHPLERSAEGEVQLVLGDRKVSPVDVSACILKHLKSIAENALGGEGEWGAVITVPAYFNDAQRQATKRAGELAGFAVERVVSEPTAAALAYGLNRAGERSKIAVYDLGGGTFDISILDLKEGVFEVLATAGDTQLGGDDLDRILAETIWEQAMGDESPWESCAAEVQAKLLEEAERVKKLLSTESSVEITLPFIEEEKSIALTLTRAQWEEMARPLVAKTKTHCLQVLHDAGVEKEDIDEIVLVGGSTRIPLVRQCVAEWFGKAPNTSIDPEEAVALGATIQAGILSGSIRDTLLLDVTPLSLGIETFGGLMNVLIARNSTIPIKAGEMFTNAVADQKSMRIQVLQGEREMAADNWKLGEFDIEFEPGPKGTARVGVQFEIDANGILHVLARDTVRGVDRTLDIDRVAVDVEDEAVEEMIEQSVEHAFDDLAQRRWTEAKLKAEELLPAVQQGMRQVGDLVATQEREKIWESARSVEEALEEGDVQKLKRAVEELDELTEHLATLILEQAMGE